MYDVMSVRNYDARVVLHLYDVIELVMDIWILVSVSLYDPVQVQGESLALVSALSYVEFLCYSANANISIRALK